ncbi:AfsR/SARP family transcriptional regulator [Virgisporangium aurantiacum]|uniref:SARP family transcriptional regulator n=1 Tax=Virgisporangium aurantiacum TaxID=175570 RepID=A0A8J3ZE03_9ACTN|nr:BTAD domain-containing putative transcriptional regulator [Virgisporangium aurantiacum]GIJ60075.1 SARP family transcriptional regulator [Virgisporangium aurantiacum]
MAVEFGVLGPMTAMVDGRPVAVPATKHRILLAALLLRANQVVTVSELVEYLWTGAPPADARGTVQTYVHRLRKMFGRPDLIVTQGNGYLVRVPPVDLDLHRFRSLLKQADEAAADADPEAESACLRAALALWRGPVLADVPSELLRAVRLAVEEDRLWAIERSIDVELAAGRYADLVSELRGLTAEHPLRERLWQQLMLALYGSGRQAEALEAFRTVGRKLREEIGIEPGEDLCALHKAMLANDVSLVTPVAAVPQPDSAAAWTALCTLPLDIRRHVGREELITRAEQELTCGGDAGRVPVMAVWGPAGVGKTALAVRIAHHLRDTFPDGQWYVRLTGSRGGREPTEVLAELLQASGLDPIRIPEQPDARAALLRARLAGRRVLLLLDDATDAAQVRPLLPGTAGPAVVVTSRSDLRGLAALHDVWAVALDVLSTAQAQTLLAQVIPDVVGESPELVDTLARLCGHLPLALRLAAANLIGRPRAEVARYLSQLQTGERLRYLAVAGDPQAAIRTTFALSYLALPAPAARLFRLLGAAPGDDVTRETAAALLGTAPVDAEDLLEQLTARSLLQQHHIGRYQLHDLLRMYAAERTTAEDPVTVRLDALRRLFDHYLSTADAAGRVLYPDLARLRRPESGPADPVAFDSPAAALSYLDAERHNLVAAIAAAEHTLPPYTWHLTDALRGYFHSHSTTDQWRAAVTSGLAAADRTGDLPAQAAMHLSQGTLFWHLARHPEALDETERAREVSRTTGEPVIEAAALINLGVIHLECGHPARAAAHFQQAIALPHADRQEFATANAHVNLAGAYLEMGDLAAAEEAATRASALCDRLGSPHSAAVARANLGQVYQAQGRLDEAATQLGEALATFRTLRSRGDTVETTANLASVLRESGHLDDALALATAAVAEAHDLDIPRITAEPLVSLGYVHLARSEYALAAVSLHEALGLVDHGGQRRTATKARIGLADVSRCLGDLAASATYARQALRDATTHGHRIEQRAALTALAYATLAIRESRKASRHAPKAIDIGV